MAVSYVSVLVVLAITYNQGVARPSETFATNDITSSERQAEDDVTLKFPVTVGTDALINLTGLINPKDGTFIVELPSNSGKESCRLEFNYANDNKIHISPPLRENQISTDYSLEVSPESEEGPEFTVTLLARRTVNQKDYFSISFDGNRALGKSNDLNCKIENFEDVDRIVIKGAHRINSMLYKFYRNH